MERHLETRGPASNRANSRIVNELITLARSRGTSGTMDAWRVSHWPSQFPVAHEVAAGVGSILRTGTLYRSSVFVNRCFSGCKKSTGWVKRAQARCLLLLPTPLKTPRRCDRFRCNRCDGPVLLVTTPSLSMVSLSRDIMGLTTDFWLLLDGGVCGEVGCKAGGGDPRSVALLSVTVSVGR